VAGSGLHLGHITLETAARVKSADEVLYVLTDAVTENWVRQNSRQATSMRDFYEEGLNRRAIYTRMVDTVLTSARSGKHVMAMFYGHPGVFVTPSHEIIARAAAENIRAHMIPGISAEDCLFADLGFDPGDTGCVSFEATDMVIHGHKPSPAAWSVIWQPDTVGNLFFSEDRNSRKRVDVLKQYLLGFYPPKAECIIYEANTYSVGRPMINKIVLEELDEIEMSGISTLVIPPAIAPDVDRGKWDALRIGVP
jgi:siroheme synthase